MSQTFFSILPLAIASAISVTSILLFLAILVSADNQVRNGFAFITGGVIMCAIITIFVLFPFLKSSSGTPVNYTLHAVIDFGLAAVCLLIVFITILHWNKPAKPREGAASGGFFKYLMLGALIRLVSANAVPPFIGAVKDVSMAQLSFINNIILSAAIILIAMSTIILPYLLFLFNKQRALKLIAPVSDFLKRNKNIINTVMLLLVMAYLTFHGVMHLNGK